MNTNALFDVATAELRTQIEADERVIGRARARQVDTVSGSSTVVRLPQPTGVHRSPSG